MRGHLFSFYAQDAAFGVPQTKIEAHFGKLKPFTLTASAGPTPVTGGSNIGGGCYVFQTGAASSSITIGQGAALLPTSDCTIAVLRRKTDTTLRNSALFGGSGTVGERIGAHVPFNDGTVYWDYGGASGANRLTFTWPSSTDLEAWVFTAGSRGSSLWRNGAKLASQSTAITRTAGTNDFFINLGNAAGSGDNQQINAFIVLDQQWGDELARWWSAEPYAHFYKDPVALKGAPDLAVQKVTQHSLLILTDKTVDIDQPPAVSPCSGGGTVASGTNPAAGTSVATATEPHAWVEITPIGGSTYRYAGLSINHTTAKYGRVLSMGKVKRVLCDADHGYEASVITTTLEDTDRVLRGLGSSLKNALVEYYIADLATLRAGGTARRYFRGLCDSWQPETDLEFSITSVDVLTARLTSIDADDLQTPVKLIDGTISDQNPLERMFDKPVPEAYGSISDEDADEPEGVWELKHVGNLSIPGEEDLGNCPLFLVCLGASAKIQSVFGGDPYASGDEPVARIKLGAAAFGDWRTDPAAFLLVHKMTGALADYFDIGGQRYSMVIGKDGHPTIMLAMQGRIPLVINFCARETTGDASGNTINSGPRALEHWLNNGVLQNATTTWLSQASFGDYSVLDTSTFATVHSRCDTLGYAIAGVLGSDYAQSSWRDRVADFCRNFAFDFYTNRHGQGCINKLDVTATASGATAFTTNTILEHSVRVDQRLDAVENTIRYVYAESMKGTLSDLTPAEGKRLYRDPYDGKWGSGLQTLSNSTSISALGGDPKGIRRSRLQEYNLVRDQVTADAVAQERLDLRAPAAGRAEVSFDLILKDGCDLELGDLITGTHWDFPWTGSRRCQVRALELDFDELTVRVTARDVDDLLA